MNSPRVHGPRATRFTWSRLDLLAIENEKLRLVVWPEHGAEVIELRHKPTDLDALWKNPRVWPPRRLPLDQPHGTRSEFYDGFHGGWFVSLPNGFHPCEYEGAPIGCHGDMRSVPWSADVVREEPPREQEELLALLDEQTRREVRALIEYEEDEDGGLMRKWFASVRQEATVEEEIR